MIQDELFRYGTILWSYARETKNVTWLERTRRMGVHALSLFLGTNFIVEFLLTETIVSVTCRYIEKNPKLSTLKTKQKKLACASFKIDRYNPLRRYYVIEANRDLNRSNT